MSMSETGTATTAPEAEGVVTPDQAPIAPAPAVRAERLFNHIDRVLSRADTWLDRWLPRELNPLACAGASANLALLVAVASGVLMLIWYSPSVQLAYGSLATLEHQPIGRGVRALHRYSSDLAMLLVMTHALRVFFARKFGGARWLPWVSGVVMLGTVWFIGWTGYWLVWDQPAQQVAVSSMRLLDALPIFGEPMGRLYVTDQTVPSLLFFVVFFLHMLLPLAIAIGSAVHLARVSRARLLPARALSLSLVAGLIAAAVLIPPPVDAPARMAVNAPRFIVDAWYLSPLALALRFQHAGLWVALFGGTAFGALVPWILGKRRPAAAYQARVEVSRCHACTQCVQDCPFDAISMVPRTDGKRFESQAQVDPSRCVGCGVCAGACDSEGIALDWFDTRSEEARLEREIAQVIATQRITWVAFLAGDAKLPALELPHYHVNRVPTASWVRPKFVERLFGLGVQGVLVLRDASVEAFAREGNRWVSDRLTGKRKPTLRPQRNASGAWRVLDSTSGSEIRRLAQEFREHGISGIRLVRPRRVVAWSAVGAALAVIIGATVQFSRIVVTNPAAPDPEFVFAFKALGDFAQPAALNPEEEAAKPAYMRGRVTEKPHRSPVKVRVSIDGVLAERTFTAKGLSHDGPSIGEWRTRVIPGSHDVTVEILRGGESAPLRWSGTIAAEARHITVVTYDPSAGFTAVP